MCPWGRGHALQSLLETPSGLIAPISAAERALFAPLLRSRSRSPPPKAALRSAPRLHSARGRGLAVKSCPPAPPEHSSSSHCSSSSASAASHVAPVRLLPGWHVRGVPQEPLRLGGAAATTAAGAHTGTRSRRCGEIQRQALACLAMCAAPRQMTTNTTPATLSCSCAPTPLSRLCCWPGSPTWMSSWLPWCRFALAVFTIAQQGLPSCRPRLVESHSWACTLAMSWRCSSGPQPSARVDVHAHWPGFLVDRGFHEGSHELDLTNLTLRECTDIVQVLRHKTKLMSLRRSHRVFRTLHRNG